MSCCCFDWFSLFCVHHGTFLVFVFFLGCFPFYSLWFGTSLLLILYILICWRKKAFVPMLLIYYKASISCFDLWVFLVINFGAVMYWFGCPFFRWLSQTPGCLWCFSPWCCWWSTIALKRFWWEEIITELDSISSPLKTGWTVRMKTLFLDLHFRFCISCHIL